MCVCTHTLLTPHMAPPTLLSESSSVQISKYPFSSEKMDLAVSLKQVDGNFWTMRCKRESDEERKASEEYCPPSYEAGMGSFLPLT